jgi:hypothetical protein
MKYCILIARLLSTLFRPIYYPVLGIFTLFTTTYLGILPWSYKFHLIAVVFLFTVVLPSVTLWFYRSLSHIKRNEMHQKQNRIVSYLITMCYYTFFLYITDNIALPRFVKVVILLFFVIQFICLFLNMKWRISMHSAGSGAIIGLLAAFSFKFAFNPLVYLCVAILFSGLVMTSRMLLRKHTLPEVLCGTLLGCVCGYFGVILLY